MPVQASVMHRRPPVEAPAPPTPPTSSSGLTMANQNQPAYLSLGRRYGLDVKHGAQQVINHLVLALLAGRLDLLDLGLGLLVRLLLGLLVSLGVLESFAGAVSHASPKHVHIYRGLGGFRPYLGLEFLVLLLLGRPVLVYLLLGLVTGLLDTLCPVLSGCASTGLGQLSSPLGGSSRVDGLVLELAYTSGRSWRRLSRPVVAVRQVWNHRLQYWRSYLEEGLDTRGVLGGLPCYYC